MKLLIQIPAYNEAECLAEAILALPRSLPGFQAVEILVVDDGSTDGTAEIARTAGADHVVRLPRHSGLAGAFRSGLEACLNLGADVIVNTDADNQYDAADIPRLVQPILDGRADLVVGDRQTGRMQRFSPLKRWLQQMGSRAVSAAAELSIPDAASGFRALTRESALRTLVLSEYSYTVETLIQAGARRAAVVTVPVHTNPARRPSRLAHSLGGYLVPSIATLLRAFTHYRPLKVFFWAGGLMLLSGLALAGRYLHFYLAGQGQGHVQSVILAAVLLIVGFQTWLIGLVADLISYNRRILEEVLYRLKKQEMDGRGRLKTSEVHNAGSQGDEGSAQECSRKS